MEFKKKEIANKADNAELEKKCNAEIKNSEMKVKKKEIADNAEFNAEFRKKKSQIMETAQTKFEGLFNKTISHEDKTQMDYMINILEELKVIFILIFLIFFSQPSHEKNFIETSEKNEKKTVNYYIEQFVKLLKDYFNINSLL